MAKGDYIHRFPWLLMATVMLLVAIGWVGVYLATADPADDDPFRTDSGRLVIPRWAKQIVWVAVGLVVFGLALLPSYTRLAHWSYALFGATLLVLVLLAGLRATGQELRPFIYRIKGSYAWVHVPGLGMNFQPSELTKIAFIMSLAFYLRYRKNFRTWRGLVPPFLMALVPTALVLYQPDLGTAMMFLPVLLLMLFAAGARGKHLLAVIGVGLVLVPLFYSSMRDYQRLRIDTWLLHGPAEKMHFILADREAEAEKEKPDRPPILMGEEPPELFTDEEKAEIVRDITSMWRFQVWTLASHLVWNESTSGSAGQFARDREALLSSLEGGPGPRSFRILKQFFGRLRRESGWHMRHATVAVGSGGLTGRGWMQGTQTQHGLLPEAAGDSLFAVLGEHFGFWLSALVVVLYLLLFIFGLDVGFSTTEPYGKLVAVGVVALFAAQSFLNMAMFLGLMPITGITLPLMSYGGSSMVSSFLALGLLVNVALRRVFLIAPRPFEWRE